MWVNNVTWQAALKRLYHSQPIWDTDPIPSPHWYADSNTRMLVAESIIRPRIIVIVDSRWLMSKAIQLYRFDQLE
jgi:hypothetical protein